ncbi:unnamed protein product [Linum trigynum]|uniref:Uncharacterized protein n=1 Tax=Linum trigynum TaxID=586398 RepID=A0AAV2CQA4_9ROSI
MASFDSFGVEGEQPVLPSAAHVPPPFVDDDDQGFMSHHHDHNSSHHFDDSSAAGFFSASSPPPPPSGSHPISGNSPDYNGGGGLDSHSQEMYGFGPANQSTDYGSPFNAMENANGGGEGGALIWLHLSLLSALRLV